MIDDYRHMLALVTNPWCWWCARGPQDSPEDWHAPWLIERAHIVSNPRVEDRRAVVLLCSLCHRVQHGANIEGALPPPRAGHMVWMKLHRDPEFYDRSFLKRLTIAALPRVSTPPPPIRQAYEQRLNMRLAR